MGCHPQLIRESWSIDARTLGKHFKLSIHLLHRAGCQDELLHRVHHVLDAASCLVEHHQSATTKHQPCCDRTNETTTQGTGDAHAHATQHAAFLTLITVRCLLPAHHEHLPVAGIL